VKVKSFEILFSMVPLVMWASSLVFGSDNEPAIISNSEIEITPPSNPEEARSRANLLHEMVPGSLQIMHRDFFDEEDSHSIPVRCCIRVFQNRSEEVCVQKSKYMCLY
jgi:hypothetical protein